VAHATSAQALMAAIIDTRKVLIPVPFRFVSICPP
jgi:hypothetical protein